MDDSPPELPLRRAPLPSERFIDGHHVSLLRNGVEAYPAMLEAIEQAEEQVLLEMYWFGSDTIGWRFANALVSAAERGLDVRVIYDAVGSVDADLEMFEHLRRQGVHVLEYNPIFSWRRRLRGARISRRDHRKILVVDAQVGFTGGINIAEEWCPTDPRAEPWRDDMVRVIGPEARDFVRVFERTWRRHGGDLSSVPVRSLPRHTSQAVQVLSEGNRSRREIHRAYLANIWFAKERVWISNSYFVPNPKVVRALIAAACRGVDVRVLLPGKIDVWVVQYASQAMWHKLLRAGVKIYRFGGNVLHAKTAVVDGRWCTVGTYNLDHLSFSLNLEVNLAVTDEGFGELMDRSFEEDLSRAEEVLLERFEQRSVWVRTLEWLFYQFRSLM